MARLFKNSGMLLGANVAGSLLGLASMALTARALGPSGFGVLALIKAYVFLIETLLTFQSWQAVIKYGTDFLAQRKEDEFLRLIKFATLLDAGAAAVGALVGCSLVSSVGHWQRWDPEVVWLAGLYSLTLLFNLSATPKAALRLFDRFHLVAAQQVAAAAVKLAGVAAAFLAGGGVKMFVAVWMVSDIFSYVLLMILGWRELGGQGFGFVRVGRASLRGFPARCAGLWPFVWTTNLNASLKVGLKELDMLVVGGVLGTAGAGLYKVVKQCAKAIQELTGPLQDALYPELTRLWARQDLAGMRRLMWRSACVAGSLGVAVWLVFVVFGAELIRVVLGPQFLAAQPVLVWYLLAVTIAGVGLPLSPSVLTMGKPQVTFWTNLVSALVYFPVLLALLRTLGLSGAGLAYIAYYLVWLTMMASYQWALLTQPSRAWTAWSAYESSRVR